MSNTNVQDFSCGCRFAGYFGVHSKDHLKLKGSLIYSERESQMKYFYYKDHTIYPTPRFKTDSGKWKLQLTVRYKKCFKIFTHNIYFNTEDEAVRGCIDFGKKLVDDGVVL